MGRGVGVVGSVTLPNRYSPEPRPFTWVRRVRTAVVRMVPSADRFYHRAVATPLPPIDTDQVARFWSRFLATGVVDPSTPMPEKVEPFGDSAELANELIGAVLNGPKRATAGALVDYELEGVPLPEPGTISIATDGAGRARAVLRTTEVRIGPLSSVDESFAWDEGEGDRTRDWWLAAHQEFFGRYLPTIGVTFDPNMTTVFERFEMLFGR
jgi:uncharacterized protein YhfF